MNYFISQFGNPTGTFGKFLSRIMNLSNKKMYKANMAKLRDNMYIFEIGYGNGRQLELIKKNRTSVQLHGIDISGDMHDAASKRLGEDAVLSIADAVKIPYEDSFFDAVITTDTFYFWERPEQVLSEIKRVLKNKGIFVNSYNTMYASSVGKARKDKGLFKAEELIKEAEKAGLKCIYQKKLGIFEKQIVFSFDIQTPK
jgi:ubiquinone/menaquinone biosynthesis C-methylase UbiE